MTTVPILRAAALDALATVLGGVREVALVNYPDHGNPGDPGIWLGTRNLLRHLGVRVGYSCSWWNLDVATLRAAVGDAPVLLNGGGNVGDLYAGQQGTRMTVLRELRDNRVIQLPQSVHFREPGNEAAFARALADHGGVTFMVREHHAQAIVRDRLGLPPVLSPDHAFGLELVPAHAAPTSSILWLTRPPGTAEFRDHGEAGGDDVVRAEWLDGIERDEDRWDPTGRLALRAMRWAARTWRPGTRGNGLRYRVARATQPVTARRWVRRGVEFLGQGEVVVTDRLHGHIFCALLGRPHVVLDNSYGKVFGTVDAWTADLPGVHRATDAAHALALARDLVGARP